MDPDCYLGALKLGGTAIAGALGLTAIFSDFKGSDGKLNKKGKAALFGISISSLIGLATSVLEIRNDRAASIQQEKRTDQIIEEANRSTQLITQIEVTILFAFESETRVLSNYKDRVISKILSKTNNLTPSSDGDSFIAIEEGIISSLDKEPSIIIEPDSILWPQEDAEPALWNLVSSSGIGVDFYKVPTSTERSALGTRRSDFEAFASLPTSDPPVFLGIRNRGMSYLYKADLQKDSWSTTGQLTSYLDIRGAELVFTIPVSIPAERGDRLTNNNFAHDLYDLTTRLYPIFAQIDFGEGRTLKIDEQYLRKSIDDHRQPTFSIILPSSRKEIRNLTDS